MSGVPAVFRPLFLIWVLVVGAAVGSFLNVVIYRLPRGFRVGLPSRSACRACRRRLAWYENVPLISYLLLLGKCRTCHAMISLRYPLVEIMTATLFVAVAGYQGLSFSTAYYCAFCAALIAITFIDLDFRIIPDAISVPFMVIGLAGSFLVPSLGLAAAAGGAAIGGLGLWLTAWLYERATGREGLGFGDVKLLAMIGAFLGPKGALGTIFISSIVGSTIGIVIMIAQKKNMKLALPYGPFLAMGALCWLFWGDFIAMRLYPHLYYE